MMTGPSLLRKLRKHERETRNAMRTLNNKEDQGSQLMWTALCNRANTYSQVIGWMTATPKPVKKARKVR